MWNVRRERTRFLPGVGEIQPVHLIMIGVAIGDQVDANQSIGRYQITPVSGLDALP